MKHLTRFALVMHMVVSLFIFYDIWLTMQEDDDDDGDEGGWQWPILYPSPDGSGLQWWEPEGGLEPEHTTEVRAENIFSITRDEG